MELIKFQEVVFSYLRVNDFVCKFSDIRIDPISIPDSLHKYDIRHTDHDGGEAATIEPYVLVNYYGSIITDKLLNMGENGFIEINDFSYITEEEYLKSISLKKDMKKFEYKFLIPYSQRPMWLLKFLMRMQEVFNECEEEKVYDTLNKISFYLNNHPLYKSNTKYSCKGRRREIENNKLSIYNSFGEKIICEIEFI